MIVILNLSVFEGSLLSNILILFIGKMASGREVTGVIISLVNAKGLQLGCARLLHETGVGGERESYVVSVLLGPC